MFKNKKDSLIYDRYWLYHTLQLLGLIQYEREEGAKICNITSFAII